jgi:hypothetical protein
MHLRMAHTADLAAARTLLDEVFEGELTESARARDPRHLRPHFVLRGP